MDDEKHLKQRVRITPKGCWEWTGARNAYLYGKLVLNKKLWAAHRLSYTIFYGYIPKRMWVLHSCDNPPCINPNHLSLGTPKMNTEQSILRGRWVGFSDKFPRGETHHHRKLTYNDVEFIREIFQAGALRQREIAKIFHVSQPTVSAIVLNKTWKSI